MLVVLNNFVGLVYK